MTVKRKKLQSIQANAKKWREIAAKRWAAIKEENKRAKEIAIKMRAARTAAQAANKVARE